jgi:hypothetical protein
MARPKEIVTRSKVVPLRVTALEKEALTLMASKAGLSTSDYIRRAAFNQKVNLRFSAEELVLYKELHQFRNHFASIANLVKAHRGSAELLAAITGLKEKMEFHLSKFSQ